MGTGGGPFPSCWVWGPLLPASAPGIRSELGAQIGPLSVGLARGSLGTSVPCSAPGFLSDRWSRFPAQPLRGAPGPGLGQLRPQRPHSVHTASTQHPRAPRAAHGRAPSLGPREGPGVPPFREPVLRQGLQGACDGPAPGQPHAGLCRPICVEGRRGRASGIHGTWLSELRGVWARVSWRAQGGGVSCPRPAPICRPTWWQLVCRGRVPGVPSGHVAAVHRTFASLEPL